jgi:hypothetical protein
VFTRSELRLAQLTVGLAGCVPVLAGGAGSLLGPALTGAAWDAASDSHFRYLSGLLVGIGLAFWTCIPALPHQSRRFRLLSAIVVLGGLARLLALPLHGWPGPPMAAALIMELAVVPLLCLWQARLARIAKVEPHTPGPSTPTLPAIAVALLAATLLGNGQPALANDPDTAPAETLRIAPVDEYLRRSANTGPRPDNEELRLSVKYPDHVLRKGNLLALKLENGRYVWLVDLVIWLPQNDGSIEKSGASAWPVEIYSLKDYWPDHGVYIVEVDLNEAWEHLLISAKTAKATKLYAMPYRDPTNPHVFITIGPRFMGLYATEVWEGQDGAWFREYKCDGLAEHAEFRRWDGPGRAIIAVPLSATEMQETLLAKTNGQWHTNACRDP